MSVRLVRYSNRWLDDMIEAVNEESVAGIDYGKSPYRDMLRDRPSSRKCVTRCILDGDALDFVGYVQVNDVEKSIWEIGVMVLARYRRRGYAYSAVGGFMREVSCRYSKSGFLAKIAPDNLASIRLFQKLGARPLRLDLGLFTPDEDAARRFAALHHELVDDTVREMAGLFKVEPNELLGRSLVFLVTAPCLGPARRWLDIKREEKTMEEDERMTREEMQRFINLEMSEGKT